MIDVSYNSVRSGLVEYICHILKTELLDYLPKFVDCDCCFSRSASFFREKNGEASNVRVGFATFDKQIHFYNIKVSDGGDETVFAERSTSLLLMILVLPGGK